MARLTYAQMAVEVMNHIIDHDSAHGYSQPNRAGDGTVEALVLSDGTEVRIHGGDYDCSELVRTCYAAAGVLAWDYWESYMWTGNERALLLASGFVQVSLDSPQPGDVLWRAGHTELYLGGGMQGGARRSETHGTTGAKGDQDGWEIARSAYDGTEWESAYRCALAREGEGEGKEAEGTEDGGSMLACIIDIKDDHSGYRKGMQVLWTPQGFEYVNHPDALKLLDDMSKHYTGRPLMRVESSAKAPWVERLAQVTVGDGLKTKGTVR